MLLPCRCRVAAQLAASSELSKETPNKFPKITPEESLASCATTVPSPTPVPRYADIPFTPNKGMDDKADRDGARR